MQLSETIKLYLTKYQFKLVTDAMDTYISTINSLVCDAVNGISIIKYTFKNVNATLLSVIKNQCIRDAKSIVKKYYSACHKAVVRNRKLSKKGFAIRVTAPRLSVLKKPCYYINNQNFKINGSCIEFPVLINGKSSRIAVNTKMTEKQKCIFASAKLGTMRIVKKNNTIIAEIVYEVAEPTFVDNNNIMGIDLGIKCPAVNYCSDGCIKFYGNGCKNNYMRRYYAYLRKKLQKSKKIKAVKHINNKEQRVMNDIDHKISHDIVTYATMHHVKVIKLEQFQNIRSTTRKSRKNNYNLHNWSVYGLAMFIEYKTRLAGIKVLYVNPAYTSPKCPICGMFNHVHNRNYTCECGFHIHRDLVGAKNICNSTEYVGDSNIRHTA